MPVFPEAIRTERLSLRQPDDAGARAEHEMIHESLDHLWPWFGFRTTLPTLEDRLALAARHRADAAAGTGVTFVVFAGERPLGKVWMERQGSTARMGWWLRAGETGKGYAVEAVRALIDLARSIGVERIEAHIDPDNASSRALAERSGFVLEEIQPDVPDRPDGERRPECVYVLAEAAPAG
jgi:RimJ/RimL family protein N-acetyltransferase